MGRGGCMCVVVVVVVVVGDIGIVLTIAFVSIKNNIQFQFCRCFQHIEHVHIWTSEFSHDIVFVFRREEDFVGCTFRYEEEVDVPRVVLNLLEVVGVVVVVAAVGVVAVFVGAVFAAVGVVAAVADIAVVAVADFDGGARSTADSVLQALHRGADRNRT